MDRFVQDVLNFISCVGVRKLKKPLCFLLDIDGTLLDDDGMYFTVFQRLLTPYGHDVTDEWYEKNVHGKADKEVFSTLMPAGTDLKAIAKQKDNLFVEVYTAHVAKNGPPVIKGLADAFALAESLGIRACAVTNAPRGAAEACIASLKASIPAAKIIEGLIIGEECERPKPFPEPYIAGMDLLGVTPKDCVVFEDSRSGTKAGVAAKCHVVGIRSSLKES